MDMDSQYLDRIRSGDVNAFRYLVKKYQNLAFAVAVRIIKNDEDAKEIVQDAFLKAYSNLHKFDGRAKFSTWLYKIVYFASLNKQRQQKHLFKEIDENFSENYAASNTENIFTGLQSEEQKKYIDLALSALSSEDSLVLTLFYLAENSIEEIIEITGWTNSNVKVKLHRSRKAFYLQLSIILKEEIRTIL